MTPVGAIDLNLLLVLDAILRHRSISRAAAELGLTQSAVSGQLRRLRALLDDMLFVRGSHGVLPTPYAEALAPYVRDAIATLRRGLEEARQFEPASARRTFTIVTTDLGEASIVPRLVRFLAAAAPGVRIRTISLEVQDIPAALKGDVADVAVSHLPGLESGFYQRALFETDYVCLARTHHPLIGARLTRSGFEQALHVVAESQSTHRTTLLERHLDGLGIRREVGLRVAHVLSIPYIVAGTDLIATVPRAFFGPRSSGGRGVQVHEVPVRLPGIDVKLVWHERLHNDPGNRWLREQIARETAAIDWQRDFGAGPPGRPRRR